MTANDSNEGGLVPSVCVDRVADAVTIADLKGRHTGTDHFAALFDTAPALGRLTQLDPLNP